MGQSEASSALSWPYTDGGKSTEKINRFLYSGLPAIVFKQLQLPDYPNSECIWLYAATAQPIIFHFTLITHLSFVEPGGADQETHSSNSDGNCSKSDQFSNQKVSLSSLTLPDPRVQLDTGRWGQRCAVYSSLCVCWRKIDVRKYAKPLPSLSMKRTPTSQIFWGMCWAIALILYIGYISKQYIVYVQLQLSFRWNHKESRIDWQVQPAVYD